MQGGRFQWIGLQDEIAGWVVPEALQLVPSNSDPVHERTAPGSMDQSSVVTDDLSRKVYGLLGVPIDAVDFPTLLQLIESAADQASPCMISTPNVNFLVKSQRDPEFRESMLQSNLCIADGMPLIWIAKLLRVPIFERVAGADLFGRLKAAGGTTRPLKVFLLGGADGVAATVGRTLNSQKWGLECAGVLNPGFGTIEEMSTAEIINTINSSHSDLLAVFFGAEKAQAWLMNNHRRLRIPVRAQFGATINFEAGTVRRAPHFLRSTGFEWLWRIKEEPYLWRRYWNDGRVLLSLLATCVLPLSIDARWRRGNRSELSISEHEGPARLTMVLSGAATEAHVDRAIEAFRNALKSTKQIVIDLSNTGSVDPRFFGLFLMIRKQLTGRGQHLMFAGAPPRITRLFRLNRFEFLLSDPSLDRYNSPQATAHHCATAI